MQEEPVALNHAVHRHAGGIERTGGHVQVDGTHLGAVADLGGGIAAPAWATSTLMPTAMWWTATGTWCMGLRWSTTPIMIRMRSSNILRTPTAHVQVDGTHLGAVADLGGGIAAPDFGAVAAGPGGGVDGFLAGSSWWGTRTCSSKTPAICPSCS